MRTSASARKAVFPFPSSCLAPRGGSSMAVREQSSSHTSVVAAVLFVPVSAFYQEESRNNEVSWRKLICKVSSIGEEAHVLVSSKTARPLFVQEPGSFAGEG